MVSKIRSRKADQAAKPGIATVHGQCMSVAISWANKKQLAKCVYMVSFPISSHIYKTFFCRPDSFYTMAVYTKASVESQLTGVCGLKG